MFSKIRAVRYAISSLLRELHNTLDHRKPLNPNDRTILDFLINAGLAMQGNKFFVNFVNYIGYDTYVEVESDTPSFLKYLIQKRIELGITSPDQN